MTDPTAPQPEQPTTPPAAPGYQAPPYQTPGYAQPGYAPAGPRTNTLAIVALVLGIVVPIGGIITGHIALSQIKKTGEAGHGLALAGTILGYLLSAGWIIFWILYVVFILFAIGTAGATGGFSSNY